jgi:hypothetical protein
MVAGRLASGDRLGDRLELEVEGEYQRRPEDRFFGVGNQDEGAAPGAMLDPYGGPAVNSRFGQTVARLTALGALELGGPISVRLASEIHRRTFRPADPDRVAGSEQITANYDVAALAGWDRGASYLYSAAELRHDSRRAYSRYDVAATPSIGALASGFAGVANGIGGMPTEYVRYGARFELLRRVGERPRVIALRGLVEAVTGEPDEIPFVDLPSLGGPLRLRGYPLDRFRDRARALASAEYQWDLNQFAAAFVFVDAGRVYPSLGEMTPADLRVGYGGGIDVHTDRIFIGRLTMASSPEGGLLVHFGIDPGHDPRGRGQAW